MARKSKNKSRKPYIIVFWEGESEEQYFKFLKDRFHEKANLNVHSKKGLFATAEKAFSSNGFYYDDMLDVDEIWIVFDTEVEMRPNWDRNWDVVKKLRRKCKNATVKLYMTKGCIEYYFLLHYQKTQPLIVSVKDKDRILKLLEREYCLGYKKGDKDATWKIAEHYETAIENGQWCLKRIADELVSAANEDERVRRLYFTDSTFTNTHEAVEHLIELKNR